MYTALSHCCFRHVALTVRCLQLGIVNVAYSSEDAKSSFIFKLIKFYKKIHFTIIAHLALQRFAIFPTSGIRLHALQRINAKYSPDIIF